MAKDSRDIRISGKQDISPPSPLHGIKKTPPPAKKPEAPLLKPSEDVSVELSQTSKEVSRAKEVIRTIPEIRVTFVSEIKESINNGTYQRSSELVAKKMVDEFLQDSVRKKRK